MQLNPCHSLHRNGLLQLLAILPPNLCPLLLEAIKNHHTYAGYILSFVIPDENWRLKIDSSTVAFPWALTVACIEKIPKEVKEIRVEMLYFTDDVLQALADCPCAATLQRLHINKELIPKRNLMTDSSSNCWAKFVSLRKLFLRAHQIRRGTLNALATSLPALRWLSVVGLQREKLDDLVGIFLQGERLPLIRTLRIDHACAHDSMQKVLDILRSRKDTASLEDIDVGNAVWMMQDQRFVTELARQFREQCPKLDLSPLVLSAISWGNEKFAEYYTNSLKTVHFASLLPEGHSEVLDPAEIASALPRVKDLTIDPRKISHGNLQCFRCVTTLTLFCSVGGTAKFIALSHLPPRLRCFHYSYDSSGMSKQEASTQVCDLYERVGTQCPEMEKLNLETTGLPDAVHLRELLASLPRLQALSLSHVDGNYAGAIEELVLSHPKMPDLPSIRISSLLVRFGCFPGIRKYNLAEPDVAPSVLFGSFPNLTRLYVDPKYPMDSMPLTTTLTRFHDSMQDLSINGPLPSSRLREILPIFRSITNLTISSRPSASPIEEDFKLILENLPLLLSFHFVFYEQLDDLDFVRHPMLSELNVNSWHSKAGLTRPQVFLCTPDRLPNITSVSLSLRNIDFVGENCPYLDQVTLRGEFGVRLTVRNCSVLRSITLGPGKVQRVHVLTATPYLAEVKLADADLGHLLEEAGDSEDRMCVAASLRDDIQRPPLICVSDCFIEGFGDDRFPGAEKLRARYPNLKHLIF